ncbi:LOW QUALITY PROTEIN: hypothetical protein RJ639_020855 [Escallonia herrerae]|uniref:DELLA protein n=1 Tax=Escallonia herrerae TaxID=1293975 RepID=A0AA88V3F4_9ASTE|nr:LOW QUALITY PROTEIN: hypothetical protein RJ639_020855 [Escallonia herrerae]
MLLMTARATSGMATRATLGVFLKSDRVAWHPFPAFNTATVTMRPTSGIFLKSDRVAWHLNMATVTMRPTSGVFLKSDQVAWHPFPAFNTATVTISATHGTHVAHFLFELLGLYMPPLEQVTEANQAILEAFANKKKVHVIDFIMKQGMQEVGWKLAQLADTIHVDLTDLDTSMLDLREDEVVAVNSVFELHPLLARPGAIEKVLSAVKEMKPEILTMVGQESNHNAPVFLDLFTESLHYYSTMFDSLEEVGWRCNGDGGSTVSIQDKVMSEVYLGRQICNLVACDGVDRVEWHKTLAQWRARLDSVGFGSVHLGSNAFKQASMLLALVAVGDGYRVEEHDGCLMLGWHSRPLITIST